VHTDIAVCWRRGELGQGEASLYAALRIARALAALNGRNTVWQSDLALALQSVGGVLEVSNRLGGL